MQGCINLLCQDKENPRILAALVQRATDKKNGIIPYEIKIQQASKLYPIENHIVDDRYYRDIEDETYPGFEEDPGDFDDYPCDENERLL